MRLNHNSKLEVVKQYIVERIARTQQTKSAREVLDDLLRFLAKQGYSEQAMWEIHLAAEEAVMRRVKGQ